LEVAGRHLDRAEEIERDGEPPFPAFTLGDAQRELPRSASLRDIAAREEKVGEAAER